MTGLPGLTEMRSLNKNGLSLITLVFTDDTDVYFARQLAAGEAYRVPTLGGLTAQTDPTWADHLPIPFCFRSRSH